MRNNLGVKTYIYPEPVLIIATYDEDNNVDVMNAAWGGICGEDTISICIDASHKTTSNLKKNKALTVSMGIRDQVKECDYVGIVSQNVHKDKMAKVNFTYTKSEFVNAPVINELPLTLECQVLSYDDETEIMIGKIINVSADNTIMSDGHIDLDKFHPIVFDPCNHVYRELGDVVGKAFNEGLKLK